jgi:hypothetical protein
MTRVSTILKIVNRVLTYACAGLIGFGVTVPATLRSQQDPESSAPKATKATPAADIFSGTVTKLTADAVTVVRRVPGHAAVTREFVRDEQTKVEGKLRERARVTVRYKAGEDDGFVAVYIIVR